MEIETLIIIVTYNSEGFIEDCLKSVTASSYRKWFLAVIDNNSIDNTIKKIKEFKNSYIEVSPRNFKLIKLKKNIGFSAAINYAIFNFICKKKKKLLNRIKHLVLVNPDLYLFKNTLSNLILPFELREHTKDLKGVGAVGGLILDYNKDIIQHAGGKVKSNLITRHVSYGKKLSRFSDSNYNRVEKLTKKDIEKNGTKVLKEVDYITGALFATDFTIFSEVGGLDTGYRPAYYEELDYCIKLKKIEKKIMISYNAVSRHFEGASVKKFSKNFYKFYHKNRLRCVAVNFGFLYFFKEFLREELRWIKSSATRDQKSALAYAYFINFIFLPYNLIVKIKNYFILQKLRLK
jgi:GT2 family glycosyltransferase